MHTVSTDAKSAAGRMAHMRSNTTKTDVKDASINIICIFPSFPIFRRIPTAAISTTMLQSPSE